MTFSEALYVLKKGRLVCRADGQPVKLIGNVFMHPKIPPSRISYSINSFDPSDILADDWYEVENSLEGGDQNLDK